MVLGPAPLYMVQIGLGRWTQVGGGRLSGICAVGTIVTLGGNAVGVSSGTLGKGAGQSSLKTTAGVGRSATGAGAVGGLVVTMEKILESV